MKEIFSILFKFGLKPGILVLAIVLAFISASMEGVSIWLVIPLMNGIISSDFSFIEKYNFLQPLLSSLPYDLVRKKAFIFLSFSFLIFIAVVVKNIFNYLSSISILFQVRLCANNLRKKIYERYLSFGKLFFDRNNIGHLQQVLITNTDQIARELYFLQCCLYQIFSLIVYLIMMLLISYRLTLVVMLTFPILFYCLKWIIKKIEASSIHYSASYSKMSSKISDALGCIPLVKAYTNENAENKVFSNLSNTVQGVEFSIDKKRVLIQPIQEIIILFIILLLLSLVAFFYTKEHSHSIASYMVYLLILKRTVGQLGSFNSLKASLAYLQGPFNEIKNMLQDENKHFILDGIKEFKGLNKSIGFKNVSFSYVDEVKIINNINFSIEKGKIIALVGQSGAGKTTLVNLLMRFYDPTFGEILIDGVNIKEFTLKSLRSKMALVSQETYLFNSSLKANLIYGLDVIPEYDEILSVLKSARLYEFVSKMPEGLETIVGDKGVKLSGGEKQRLSIARAMLKNAEILILDEATSSLDSETEKLIKEAIDELIRNKTVIIIAHRLSTIKNADKIIVLEDGKIQEEGVLDELVKNKDKFYKYWTAQKF